MSDLQITNVCLTLASRFEAFILSGITSSPSDIDVHIDRLQIDHAVSFLLENNFTISYRDRKMCHYVFRRFEPESNILYVIDLFSNITDQYLPHLIVFTDLGSRLICRNPRLYTLFKTVAKQGKPFSLLQSELLISSPRTLATKIYAKYSLFESVISLVSRRIMLIKNKIQRGKRIAFIGPDGSGKTFVISLLSPLHTKTVYMGDWFFMSQPLINLIKRIIPHPFNRIVRIIYPLENMLRILRSYSYGLRGFLVLYDRYPGLNQHVSKGGIVGFFNTFEMVLYPCPAYVIHLFYDSQTIISRKQELNPREIDNWNFALASLLKKHPILKRVSHTFSGSDVNSLLNLVLSLQYSHVPQHV